MKEYKTPILEIYILENSDVITASNSNDNNFDDIEDWD